MLAMRMSWVCSEAHGDLRCCRRYGSILTRGPVRERSMSEGDHNRGSVRRRTLKEGKLVLDDWATVDCVIRDLSETGARVEFSGMTEVPEQFRLLIMSANVLMPAKRAWQLGLSIGVHFTGPPKPAPPRKW